jgi:hypothetical protein
VKVNGTPRDAEDLFNELVKGGTKDTNSTHPRQYNLPGGEQIGFRPKSKSGPPTIDVNATGIPITKIKFV